MAQSGLETLAHAAAARWGAANARVASGADSIDGWSPGVVLEPPDVETLADMLRWANLDKLTIVPRGAGTKQRWGRCPVGAGAVLSTTRLSERIDHCAGDLTVTAPAGARLSTVNALLARERQWLPLDPRASGLATIGGIVATGDSGPRRQQHGTPRDLIIGIEMALADGRRAKAGGRVVKNVAGYDLARLLCGSFGSLAVITSATFKLAPTPPASCTLIAELDGTRRLAELALDIAAGAFTPSAVEIETDPERLLIRIESTEAATRQLVAGVRDRCEKQGAAISTVGGEEEDSLWRDHEERLSAPGTLVRLAVLPTQVNDVIEHVRRVASRFGVDERISGRAALGVLYVLFADEAGEARASSSFVADAPAADSQPEDRAQQAQTHAAAVEELRRNAWARGGSAVVVAGSPAVKSLVDPWGDFGDGGRLLQAVKARFDPNGILNRGRGPDVT